MPSTILGESHEVQSVELDGADCEISPVAKTKRHRRSFFFGDVLKNRTAVDTKNESA